MRRFLPALAPIALGLLFVAALPARANDPIDLNRAGVEELQQLPGIGAAKARAIVEERDRNGPYSSVNDLDRVKGIGASLIARLAPLAYAGDGRQALPARPAEPARPPPTAAPAFDALDRESPEGKVNLNVASEDDLLALAGMSLAHAKVIVAWRTVKGPFRRVGDLQRVPGLPQKLVHTIAWFVATRVDAAKATEAQLSRLGVSGSAAGAALAQRRKGALKAAADVEAIPGLSEADREALRASLWFPR